MWFPQNDIFTVTKLEIFFGSTFNTPLFGPLREISLDFNFRDFIKEEVLNENNGKTAIDMELLKLTINLTRNHSFFKVFIFG